MADDRFDPYPSARPTERERIYHDFDALCERDATVHAVMTAAMRAGLDDVTAAKWAVVELAKQANAYRAELTKMLQNSARPMLVCCAGKHGEEP